MEEISKLIKEYENKLIDIERSRASDNRAGDHSFYMEYDTAKENINEFIGELRKLQALTIPVVVGRSEKLIAKEQDAFNKGYTKGWTEGFNSGKINGD